MDQLAIQFKYDEGYLRDYFERAAGYPLELTLTDNSSRMLSVKKEDGIITVRLHRIFLEADGDVIEEIAGFINKRRGSTPLVRGFLRKKRDRVKKSPSRKITLKPRGRHYDLVSIFDEINKEYFGDAIEASITWGSKAPRYSVRKRTLGSFGLTTNIIRINPVLDSKRVPPYFIGLVVYHEMLHAHLGVIDKNGRKRVHTGEFKEREKLFKDYHKAVSWEKMNRV